MEENIFQVINWNFFISDSSLNWVISYHLMSFALISPATQIRFLQINLNVIFSPGVVQSMLFFLLITSVVLHVWIVSQSAVNAFSFDCAYDRVCCWFFSKPINWIMNNHKICREKYFWMKFCYQQWCMYSRAYSTTT